MKQLESHEFDTLVDDYVEIVVDRMEVEDLVEFVTETLTDRYARMSQTELREYVIEFENSGCPEDNLYDELADNVSSSQVQHCVADGTDYSECVDRLVESMEGN